MANIVFINLLSRMTMATGHLMGTLLSNNHQTHTINFKRQESRLVSDIPNDHNYQPSDFPMRTYGLVNRDIQLEETSGWKKISPLETKNLVIRLHELQPDAIGLTCLSHALSLAEEVSAILKQHFNCPIIIGGVGAITEPQRSIGFTDLACKGEGEAIILEIAQRLDDNQDLSGITGTLFKLPNGEIQDNGKAPLSDLSSIALPNYDPKNYTYINGLRFEREVPHNHRDPDKSFQIMTQRGCPFSCSFCIESYLQIEFGKKEHLRRTSVDRAIAELKYAKEKLGFESIAFWDDVFPINPDWLDEFLPRYKKEIGLPFFCYTYPSTTKPDVLAKLKDAGCRTITMGIQSGSERILHDIFDRRTKQKQVLDSAKVLIESGIPFAHVDLIPKTAFDTIEDLEDTLQLLINLPQQLSPTFFNELAIYPNYPIHKKLQEHNVIGTSNALPESTYIYYFKLMTLTRYEKFSKEFILELHSNPIYRENHSLLNQYLPSDEENLTNAVPGHQMKKDEKKVVNEYQIESKPSLLKKIKDKLTNLT